jgi:hypothetical protein
VEVWAAVSAQTRSRTDQKYCSHPGAIRAASRRLRDGVYDEREEIGITKKTVCGIPDDSGVQTWRQCRNKVCKQVSCSV